MYLYNTWEETGDESVECRALRKFLRQIELHKTGQVYFGNLSRFSNQSTIKEIPETLRRKSISKKFPNILEYM